MTQIVPAGRQVFDGEGSMAKNEKTSARVGSAAGRALSDPKASKRERSLAGSALTQMADKKKAKKKMRSRK